MGYYLTERAFKTIKTELQSWLYEAIEYRNTHLILQAKSSERDDEIEAINLKIEDLSHALGLLSLHPD